MITQIHGILENVEGQSAHVRLDNASGSLTYEVLLPAYSASRMLGDPGAIGQPISFYTAHYYESQAQGAVMIPRLAGFESAEDRAFFNLFTTVKGIGNRKALRAMSLQVSQIAGAIVDRDPATLQSLPEIGRRTAETIIATLREKVDGFVSDAAYAAGDKSSAIAATPKAGSISRHALEALLKLGENRVQAIQWIDQAMLGDEKPKDVEELIARVYLIKAG